MIETVNPHVEARVNGILSQLRSSYVAGKGMSNAVKGFERELFISGFLSQVFPTHYRFASGDITDTQNQTSGQIDIVLEFPHGFSFPVFPAGPRLFLAESVAAAIEVKSNLASQWSEIEQKARKLAEVRRRFAYQYYREVLQGLQSGTISNDRDETPTAVAFRMSALRTPNQADEHIPFYAVGFEGWTDQTQMSDKVIPGIIDGIFQIHAPHFAGEKASASGATALVMLLEKLEDDVVASGVRMPVLVNYFIPRMPPKPAA